MKKSILFIEDNDQTRELYRKLLDLANFNVDSASDGNMAYVMMSKKKYDLMLLDLMMTGMDGLTLLDAMKKKKIHSKIVIFSNVSPDNVLQRINGITIADYIVKSDIRPDIFIDRIKKLLN